MKAFHSFDDPEHDLSITGLKTPPMLRAEADAYFRHGVEGKTVIDVGAWDGWFTFEAERRGAKDVTACDWFCWGGPGWGTREVFDHVREATGSKAKDIECDIPNLHPDKHGMYDVVLLLGVIYHVPDMLTTINRAQALCHNHLVIETASMEGDDPVARYWTRDTLNGDGSNFWTPTVKCVQDMCHEFGFERFESERTPIGGGNVSPARHIIHAFRS